MYFQTRLSSIRDNRMAKCALTQVCKLVDEDSAETRMELSRLLSTNSALAEKVNSLKSELTVVKSEPPKLITACRSVGLQTEYRDEDVHCWITQSFARTSFVNKCTLESLIRYSC